MSLECTSRYVLVLWYPSDLVYRYGVTSPKDAWRILDHIRMRVDRRNAPRPDAYVLMDVQYNHAVRHTGERAFSRLDHRKLAMEGPFLTYSFKHGGFYGNTSSMPAFDPEARSDEEMGPDPEAWYDRDGEWALLENWAQVIHDCPKTLPMDETQEFSMKLNTRPHETESVARSTEVGELRGYDRGDTAEREHPFAHAPDTLDPDDPYSTEEPGPVAYSAAAAQARKDQIDAWVADNPEIMEKRRFKRVGKQHNDRLGFGPYAYAHQPWHGTSNALDWVVFLNRGYPKPIMRRFHTELAALQSMCRANSWVREHRAISGPIQDTSHRAVALAAAA